MRPPHSEAASAKSDTIGREKEFPQIEFAQDRRAFAKDKEEDREDKDDGAEPRTGE